MDGPRTIFGEEFSRDTGFGVYPSGNCEATKTEAEENGKDLTDSHGMWNNDLGCHVCTRNDVCLPLDKSRTRIGLSRASFVESPKRWINDAQMAPS